MSYQDMLILDPDPHAWGRELPLGGATRTPLASNSPPILIGH
ncbi:MAG TPA: hypothetical protein VGG86_02795 [Roseiarcus sp.]|jgi:hypothetical protein